ncbi:MAG: SET domain-containing protein-lysine N-methyltransferase [Candidatus Krumholzibacteria bacterium]|nr:SET domain-containing protein-lysine N-methyltransferase [Candidatus Krumholzibacteria bacterium]
MEAYPTGYVSPKLVGSDVSNKGNHGVFALQHIGAGELLVVWGGEIIAGERLAELPAEERRLCLQVEEDLYLWTTHEGPADWVNHSCEPNAGLSGQVALVALRDIDPGEEICFDYATSDGAPYDEFDCRCGALACRGRVTGDDWRRAELQARYRGLFSPYLQRRIDVLAAERDAPRRRPVGRRG